MSAPAPGRGRRSSLAPGAVIAAWLVLSIVCHFVYFDTASLLDHHAFRQTQTASIARELLRGGPLLAHLLPLFGPPWSVPFELPLYQAVVAKLAATTGLGLEPAGRLTSLAATLACLLSIWRLAVLFGLGTRATVLALAAFAFSPAALYWSQSFMIETFALAACLLMCVCVAEFAERRRVWPLAGGVVFAACAALVKATTFVLFAIVAALHLALHFAPLAWRDRADRRAVLELAGASAAYALVLFLPAVVLLAIWIDFADSVKAASPLAAWLQSSLIEGWVFGDAADFRRAMSFLVVPFRGAHASLGEQFFGVSAVVIVPLALVGLAYGARGHTALKAVLVVGFFAGPAIFSNVFAIHYYYWVANLVFATSLLAFGLDGASRLGDRALAACGLSTRWTGSAIAGVLLMLLLAGNFETFRGFFLSRTIAGVPVIEEIADRVRQNTAPDDIVVTFGYDWNPALQYYSDRRMVMAREPGKAMDHAQALGLEPAAAVFCGRERAREFERLQHPLFAGTAWTALDTPDSCRVLVPGARRGNDPRPDQ